MSFTTLGLAEPLLRAVNEQGYDTPSPIQAQAIPAVLTGRDIMAAAQTGTGKTAGFTLPLLQRLSESGKKVSANRIRALVLTPTRELAAQVQESVATYGKFLPLRSAVVFGGVGINPQMMALRKGVDVLVATPGRLMDLYQQNAVRFNELEILVLDEADRMLDMGFIHDIKKVLALLPKQRQNLLFSATFSGEIRTLAAGLLNNPLQIDVAPRNTTAERIEQTVYAVDRGRKTELLSKLIRDNNWEQVLVFTRTKHGANRLAEKLARDGIGSAAIHGNKSQGARTKALADFKANTIRVLVATDIAARGLDIEQLPHVVNFELPNVAEDYVHRIGRTGRAGASGEAISLVERDEEKLLKAIERLTKQTLPRQIVAGFKPDPNAPRAPEEDDRPPRPPQSRRPRAGGSRSAADSRGEKSHGESRGNKTAAVESHARSGHAPKTNKPHPHQSNQRRSSGAPASRSRAPGTGSGRKD